MKTVRHPCVLLEKMRSLVAPWLARVMSVIIILGWAAPSLPVDRAVAGAPEIQDTPEIGATQYLSIPAAAFHPMLDAYTYSNIGYSLHVAAPSDNVAVFVAALQLQHGTTIHKVRFLYRDINVSSDCYLIFGRVPAVPSGEPKPGELLAYPFLQRL